MPAPILRSYSWGTTTVNTWTDVAPAVPTSRALVVATLLLLSRGNGTVGCSIRMFDGSVEALLVPWNLQIANGQSYVEKALVIPAGWRLQVFQNLASGVAVSVHGEEVDN